MIFKDLFNLILWSIKFVRPTLSIYLIVSKDSMKFVSLEDDQVFHGTSKFSSERLLIADPIEAEKLGFELLGKLFRPVELKTKNLKVFCHPLDSKLGDLSQSELMIFRDFSHRIGGKNVCLMSEEHELSPAELKNKDYA